MALLGGFPLPAPAARPDTVEIKDGTGSLGRLPRVVVDDGGSYVAAEKLTAILKGAWSAKGARATLTVGKRSAQFVRDQPRVVVQGQTIALDAAARTGAGTWLIPEDFLVKGLPKLVPGVAAAAPEPKKPVARAGPGRGAVRGARAIARIRPSPGSWSRRAARRRVRAGPGQRRSAGAHAPPGALRHPCRGDRRRSREGGSPRAGRAPMPCCASCWKGAAGDVKASALHDPFRLVLDVLPPAEGPSAGAGQPGLEPLRLIVLDAGHGGHDPGATGPSGLTEKEVVLDVTRRVARMVEERPRDQGRAHAASADIFVPLRDRTNFANKQRADLFVSIHANAHPRAVSEGVETYFLSSEASDNDARQVAAVENGVVQLESPTSRAKGGPAQEHPVGPRPVRVPAGVELHGRDRPGLHDAVPAAWSTAGSSRRASMCWAARRCPPS